MVDEGSGFPSEGEGGVGEVPTLPLQTEIGETSWMEAYVIISTLAIACSLEMTNVDVTHEVRDVIKSEGAVLNPEV